MFASDQRCKKKRPLASRENDKPVGVFGEHWPRSCGLVVEALGEGSLNQLEKVGVAGLTLCQYRKVILPLSGILPHIPAVELYTEDRLDPLCRIRMSVLVP